MTETLLEGIAQAGIAFAFLVAAVMYFLKKEQKKEDEILKLNIEIKELHVQMKDEAKESLTALIKFSALIDKLLDEDKGKHDSLISEIKVMRDDLIERINNLK